MAEKIKTRIQMAHLLHERMNKSYSTLFEKQELEPDTTLVKTYLKEAHLPENSSGDKTFDTIKRVFSFETLRKDLGFSVRRTEEEYFYQVDAFFKREPVSIYLDATNTRFWILHSMNSSIALDNLLESIVSMTPLLDNAWIPTHLLEAVAKFGNFRGLGLDYDRRFLPDVDFESDSTPVEYLKMQLFGNKAADVLRILREEGAFPHETTLSKVKIKHWINNNSEFSIDDIKYDGKITARGTSFQSHIEIIQEIYGKYQHLITKVENEFALHWILSDNSLSLRGEPVNFIFERPIVNLKSFCKHLFDASEPFRLWGVPNFINDKFARVAAVDLHVGTRLMFEITSDFIRIFLPDGGCGNSIVRVYTNLQHYYDSLIKAQNGDERSVFE